MKRRCRYEVEVYRIGRAVADMRQCRRQTDHPSGLCWQHRSDTWEDQ